MVSISEFESCMEVNDIILLDSWGISAQGHFTKNTDLFPVKIRINFNCCPMKEYVIEDHWNLSTNYVHDSNSNGGRYIKNLEYELLKIVLQDMNMTYIHVPIPESYRMYLWTKLDTLSVNMRSNVFDIAVGDVGLHYLFK